MNNKTINILGIILVSFLVQNLNAQTTEQMRKWAFNGVEVDFTGTTVTTQTISTPISNANGAYASYYDENDDLVVRVVDNNIYDNDNNNVGSLFNDPEGNDLLADQIVIAPQDQSNNCYYDIFYAVSVNNRNHLELRRAVYNPGIKQIVDEEVFISWPSSYTKGTIALSDFVGTTSERRLYMAVTSNNMTKSGDTLQIAYFRGPNWRHEDTYIQSSSSPAAVGELELSADMSILAYTRPFANAGNQGQLMLHVLNSTGGFWGGTSIHYNIDPTFTKHFAGLELTNNNQYAFVNGMGDGLYRINISNLSSIYNNGYIDLHTNSSYFDFSYSQIERAHNDRYYMVKPNGDLWYFTDQFNSIIPEVNIGSNAVINNAIHANDPYTPAIFNFYLIPDQIDGCEYTYTNGDEVVCCYAYNETPANANMTGVQIQTSGTERDIIIQSGNSVTWTATSNSFGNVAEAYMEPGDIIIEPGASLTIEDMIIHFREGYEIQMDDNSSGVGSRLVLDNTTLTVFDECEGDKLWAGIDLNGGWGSLPQTPYSTSPQPYLKMQNGSTIEFAEKGVDAPAGGFIHAYDSYFVNNIVNVDISGYTDQHSILSRCVLKWNDELYGKGYNPASSLHLWKTNGVQVLASHFSNEASSGVSMIDRGTGILADLSDFTVKGLCANFPDCTGYDRNSFENLNYAIKSNSGNDVLIDRSDFSENLRGAWIINSNALQFTRNDIDVYYGQGSGFFANNSFGLYLEACTGYQVEENLFRDGRLGLIVFNSGVAENEIYLNDFENLTGNGGVFCSAVNMGINANSDRLIGLQYRCNLFSNTNKALAITGGYINTQSGGQIISDSYIKRDQGTDPVTQAFIPANNLFWLHGDPMSMESDFYIDSDHAAYHYKYNSSSDNIPDFDADLNSFNIDFVTPSPNYVFTTRAQECPSNLSGGQTQSLLTSSLDEKEEELDQSQTEYESLTAVQDETSLSISAETSGTTNMNDVHNNLIEASPYLTASVLNAYMMNDQISEMARANVLLANSPLPETVLENLPQSNINQEVQHYILQQQEGENPLLAIQNHINGLKAAKQYLTDRLHIMNMNSDDEEAITAWKQALESKSDFHSKEKLVSLYKSTDDYEAAENLLANLETELIGSDKPEKLKQVRIAQIDLNLRDQDSMEETNSAAVDYLYSLADDYNQRSGSMARGILMAYGYETYDPVFILPDETTDKSAAANAPANEALNRPEEPIELEPLFNIFPNPVNDKLSVEFIAPGESCSFIIMDVQGRQVKTIQKDEALGYLSIDVSQLESGTYILYSPQLNERKQFVVKR